MKRGPHVIGTREDPHAQAREARTQPLLLHSMALFRELFAVVFAHRKITTVVEVGVESGQVSALYLDLGASDVHCIDPEPSDELRARLAEHPALHLVERPSPAALAELPVADLYVVDGDHNYAVVHAELSWIMANAPDAVVVLHDVLWPCSRRDLYYEPSTLAAEDRNPSTADGPTVWHDGMTPAGFAGAGAFTSAQEAGGERNGVLTAIEDALAAADAEERLFGIVPAVFGMGVAVRRSAPGAEEIMEELRPHMESHLLAAMENNRIALYTRVLQMQYEAVAHADHADRLAEAIAAQRHEIDRLNAELAASGARITEAESVRRDLEQQVRELAARPALGAAVRRALGRR